MTPLQGQQLVAVQVTFTPIAANNAQLTVVTELNEADPNNHVQLKAGMRLQLKLFNKMNPAVF